MKSALTERLGARMPLLAAVLAIAALAFVLVGCSSGASSASSASADASSSAAASDSAASEEAEDATVEIDAAAFDELVASGPVASDDEIAANAWATKVKEAGKLRVGGTRTSTLFSLLNETDGGVRGFDAGLYQLLANYILGDSQAYELTQVTSDTRESVITTDQVDAVFATYSITPARAEVISFAGPYYTSQQGILVLADNADINGVDDLAGKVVAVQSGSTGPEIVEEFAPEATTEEYATDEEARAALEQGRVDAYVIDITLHMGSITKNPGVYRLAGDPFGPIDPYGIGVELDSDAVDFINGFLSKIESDGTWAKLWQVSLGDRIDSTDVPTPPTVGDLSFLED